ncbi:uncharacterized protein LOC110383380, partial [Helicoverpa armigera]|uniref:uncharacterized protein LOC110383380 n=1 Tax=Helicoverpa armigera TaxID=29058 RepID=UPI0030826CDB
MKWKELSNQLNSEGTGESRSEEKWRKEAAEISQPSEMRVPDAHVDDYEIDWNIPGTSSQPTVAPPRPPSPRDETPVLPSTEAHPPSPK